jgi:hypothetical protein
MGETEARGLNSYYKDEPKSKRTKRNYIGGALYQHLYEGYHEIDHAVLGDMDVAVQDVESRTTTTIKVRRIGLDNPLLTSIVDLGGSMPKKGTCRREVGDLGEMYGLGYRSKARGLQYKQTRVQITAGFMEEVATGVKHYMREHFADILEDIRSADCRGNSAEPLQVMGGKEGPGGTMVVSCNLGNSSHYDFSDQSQTFVIWAEKRKGVAENWFLVFPNMSINGSKGVVIRLHHGIAISWDAKKLRHCSSIADTGEDNSVYGCGFVACRN